MGMLGSIVREGSWILRSVSDPRWNYDGRGMVGGLIMPVQCKEKIEQLRLTLGELPDDLGWSYMKD